MSRVLLSGFRLRLGDNNFDPPPSGSPYRLRFFDSSTSLPKLVYAGPDIGDSSLGSIVALDAQGYVPVSGIWLDIGKYNIALEQRIAVDPINGDTWNQLWMISKVAGGVESGIADDASITFTSTISDIRALDGIYLGGVVFNLGYYNLNDGGQGEWRWVSTSLEVDDGGAYLKPTAQSLSVPGRWHRVMPSGGEVDVRMWGAVSGQLDVSGNIELAQQWCARTADDTGITLAFPSAMYNISSATLTLEASGLTLEGTAKPVKYHIYQNAQFIGATGVAKVYINSPTIIDSTSPIIGFGISIYFASGSVDKIDDRWWVSTNDRTRLVSADAHGLPIYINHPIVLNTFTNISNKIILGPSGYISAAALLISGTAAISLNGGIEVLGSNRIALGVGLNGSYNIKQEEIQAWWFGYGSLPGNDQAIALNIAFQCANLSKATCLIDTIAEPMGIYSNCGIDSIECQVRINGIINIYDGANLYLSNVLADRKHIFNIVGTSAAPITIEQGVIYPEWFGAKVYTNSNSAFHWMMQISARSLNKGSIKWIDGGGNSYTLTETIYMIVGGIGLRDMTIFTTTETESIAAIYMGSDVDASNNYELRNVNIVHLANGERRPTILMELVSDVFIRDCKFTVNHGIVFTSIGANIVQICGNNINLSNGAMLYTNIVGKTPGSNIDFYNNYVTGINNTIFGSTATVQILPSLFSTIHDNRFLGTVYQGSPATITLCRDSSLDIADAGQVLIRDNLFIDCKLIVRVKNFVTIRNNDFRGSLPATTGTIILQTYVSGEVVTYLRIQNNNGKLLGDWTSGYINTTPSVFYIVASGNGTGSICTHKTTIIQRTLADTTPSDPIDDLFPNAYITSLQCTMLCTNTSLNGTSGYDYAIIGGVSIAQNNFPQADAQGRFYIATTRASVSREDETHWVQWSVNIGSSWVYLDR